MLPIRPKKELGQHFLTDKNIAKNIANSLKSFSKNSTIIEIGPGSGFLTRFLIELDCEKLILIDADSESIGYLKEQFQNLKNNIFHKDILSVDIADFSEKPVSIIGNMPYNISGPLLFMALEQRKNINEWVGMLQKEVAERIVAKTSTKAYGILSVLIQAYFETEMLFSVPPSVFIPPPKVNSAVIRIIPKTSNFPKIEYFEMKKIVKTAFNQRRKTMRNSLKGILSPDILSKSVFNKRPEELVWQEFEEILNY